LQISNEASFILQVSQSFKFAPGLDPFKLTKTLPLSCDLKVKPRTIRSYFEISQKGGGINKKTDYATPLYKLPLPQLYGMVRHEGDRLGLTKEQLTPIALAFFGGIRPDPITPANIINLTYYLRTLWQPNI
jgi:hypothetical protein